MTQHVIAVELEPIDAKNPKRREYVVKLDGAPVLHTGGTSVPDHGEAQAFARGLALGLRLGAIPR